MGTELIPQDGDTIICLKVGKIVGVFVNRIISITCTLNDRKVIV